MRLIVMGQQAFGKSALETILDAGKDEVVAVYCAPDKDGRMDPIKEFALEKGLTVMQPDNFEDAAVLDEMRAFEADLCVMAYVIIFVPVALVFILHNGNHTLYFQTGFPLVITLSNRYNGTTNGCLSESVSPLSSSVHSQFVHTISLAGFSPEIQKRAIWINLWNIMGKLTHPPACFGNC